jgi:hypothetical protein
MTRFICSQTVVLYTHQIFDLIILINYNYFFFLTRGKKKRICYFFYMNKNEISLSLTNIIDDTTSQCSSKRMHHYIPKDLFSCLICYETFGVDQQELVALKCGHMFCATCIKQWFTTNKGLLID